MCLVHVLISGLDDSEYTFFFRIAYIVLHFYMVYMISFCSVREANYII